MIKRKMTAREGAAKILIEVIKNRGYANLRLKEYLSKWEMAAQERGLCTEIVYGTIQNLLRIDFYISKFSSVKLNKISSWIKSVLRSGIYQLLFLDGVPSSAVCNEAVKLAKRQGTRASGFVNAVLREINREKDNLPMPDGDETDILSIMYSVPRWIIELWEQEYGKDVALQLAKTANKKRKTVIRVNTLKTTSQGLISILKDEGIQVLPVDNIENALEFSYTGDISRLASFKGGYFYVQDTAAQLCVHVLDPKPNETVVDMCAAPGGKTVLAAQLMKNKGKIHAFDIHPHKVDIIRSNAKRLSIDIINGQAADSRELNTNLVDAADRVLCDVPCSGLGIMQKKPEIRYKSQDELLDLPKLQFSILKTGSKYVKIGGVLVYATCTLNTKENENVIDKFLSENNNFVPYDIKSQVPCNMVTDVNKGGITLFWNKYNTDGFFIYRMRRV